MRPRGKVSTTDHDAEEAADASAARLKHRVAVQRLRLRWQAEGYDPQAHLRTARTEGDTNVLQFMVATLHYAAPSFVNWLAKEDVIEMARLRHQR